MYCIREIKVFKYKTRKPSLIKSETARKYLYEEKSMRKSSNGADDRTARHLKRMRKATQDQLDQKCEEVPKDKRLSVREIFTLFEKMASSVEIKTHTDMGIITNISLRIQDLSDKDFEEVPNDNRISRRENFTMFQKIYSSVEIKTPADLKDIMDDLMCMIDLDVKERSSRKRAFDKD